VSLLALAPAALAAGHRDPKSWALLADTHIAADPEAASRGVKMAENLARTCREIRSLESLPSGVFVVGDCAFGTGQTGDYRTLAETLQPLREHGVPIHLALGNHDNRERFWDVLAEEKSQARPVSSRQTALIQGQGVNWLMLDSLEETNSTPGLLGKEQLGWLASALDARPDTPAIVVVHHNPGLNGNMGLKDTLPLFEVIRPRRQVKAYVFGHTHTWKVEQDETGLHLVNLPPVSYVFKEGEPSGWVHARVEPDGMTLELRSLDSQHKDHGRAVHLKWRDA